MKSIFQFIFFIFFFSFISILRSQSYDFATPSKTISLPSVLREISDISTINNNLIACVQDEKGILFKYNLKKNVIASQDSFYLDGDYEGIARVNSDIFVLRGDGVILEIKNGVKGKWEVQLHQTNIPATNNEGLCYDAANNYLLIACKSRNLNDTNARDKRMIYAFDLTTKKLLPEPVFEINIPHIKKYISEKYSMANGITDAIKFKPSAIAIHPISKKLYLLSASGYLLCVFNKGVFESAERLNPVIFNKAEGICFLKNGDMLISNEGQLGNGTLVLMKYKRE